MSHPYLEVSSDSDGRRRFTCKLCAEVVGSYSPANLNTEELGVLGHDIYLHMSETHPEEFKRIKEDRIGS